MNPETTNQVQYIPENTLPNHNKSGSNRNWLLIVLGILFVGPLVLFVGTIGLLVFVAFLGGAADRGQASVGTELQPVPVKAASTTWQQQDLSRAEQDAPEEVRVLDFRGERYVLAYASGNLENGIINEYILEGDSLDHWTKLLSVRYDAINVEPKVFANNVVQVISERYPESTPHVYVGQDSERARVDFAVNSGEFAELNFFIYQTPANTNGLISYQYAERAYSDQADSFIGNSQNTVDELTPYILDFDFPPISMTPTAPPPSH